MIYLKRREYFGFEATRMGATLEQLAAAAITELAEVVLQGKLSNLHRKTSEPIAYLADRERKPVQNFVGAGAWNDEAVLTELRQHVRQEWSAEDGVLVLDGSGFPKKGTESCGV